MLKSFAVLIAVLATVPSALAQQASCQVPKFSGCPAAKPAFDSYYACWKSQYKLVSSQPLSNIALNFCCTAAQQQANLGACKDMARNKMAHDLTPLRCAQQMGLYSQALLACPK